MAVYRKFLLMGCVKVVLLIAIMEIVIRGERERGGLFCYIINTCVLYRGGVSLGLNFFNLKYDC
jgi:hypothetical protein